MKQSIKVAAARAADICGLTQWAEARMGCALTIVTLHRVLPDELAFRYPFPTLALPRSHFEGLLRVLQEHYVCLPVDEALARLGNGARAGEDKPIIALSFDDGYADNVKIAAPLMKCAGIRGTFYVVAGLVDTDGEFWYDQAARRFSAVPGGQLRPVLEAALGGWPEELAARPTLAQWMRWLKSVEPSLRQRAIHALAEPGRTSERGDLDLVMTSDEIVTLADMGHEIGSHTWSHPLLPQLDDSELNKELGRSRERLSSITGKPVTGFCYPNGDHDDRVVTAVRRAGYLHACTTMHGRNPASADVFRLRRVDLHAARCGDTRGRFDSAVCRAAIGMLTRWH